MVLSGRGCVHGKFPDGELNRPSNRRNEKHRTSLGNHLESRSMLTGDLVVLDFETTGLSPEEGDRITEVAAIRIRNDRIVERFESVANAGRRLSEFIIQLTGITQK